MNNRIRRVILILSIIGLIILIYRLSAGKRQN
jgi:hypothetical protein